MESIEKQLLEKITDATWDIDNRKLMKGYGRRSFDDIINKKFEIMEYLYKKMEKEANSETDSSKKQDFIKTSSELKSKVQKLKLQFEKSKGSELFQVEDIKSSSNEEEGKKLLKESTEILKGSSKTIDNIMEVVIDTNKIAVGASENVIKQGEQIDDQLEKVELIGTNVNKSRTILGRMGRNQVIQSLVLVVIMLILLFVIGTIIYFVAKPYLSSTTTSK